MDHGQYLPARRPRTLLLTEGGRRAIIMIGPVRGPEHVTLVHRLGFYHVPVSSLAASRAAVGFVAFYEPAARFGTAVGVIREYAEVVRVTRVARRELPGLTWSGRGGPDTPYYRFDLGPILSLPEPITNPDGLRVVFRFPDVDRFRHAASVRDLGENVLHARQAPGHKTPAGSSDSQRRTEEE